MGDSTQLLRCINEAMPGLAKLPAPKGKLWTEAPLVGALPEKVLGLHVADGWFTKKKYYQQWISERLQPTM